MAHAARSASAQAIPVAAARSSRMPAKPCRTKRKSASAERCWRPLGAAIALGTPTCRKPMMSVRGTLSHGGLRKGNPDSQVMTGFYRSPGIAASNLISSGIGFLLGPDLLYSIAASRLATAAFRLARSASSS